MGSNLLAIFSVISFLIGCSSGWTFDQIEKKYSVNDSLNFLVIGDWGGLPVHPFFTPIEKAIAYQMAMFAKSKNVQFVLALGDNFYFEGVKSVEDKRFQETYDAIFSEPSLYIDWYLLAGNHDHNGNVSAQIQYSTWEKRWNFPNYYYLKSFSVPGNLRMDVLMIDTVLLCGNSDHDFLRLTPKGPDNIALAEQQWAWIEKQLAMSKADYLLVAGHYPIWSIGTHGPTKCLTDRLDSLLHNYSASAYLCGHDHNLQHLEYTSAGITVQYFLSGASNWIDPLHPHKHKVPMNSSKFFWGHNMLLGGFGLAEVSKTELKFSFMDTKGSLLYSKSIPPRKDL